MSVLEVLVGRQPIFARDRRVIGYELLFRPMDGAESVASDGDLLTSTVVFGAAAIGIDRLVGDKLVFLNADRGRLTGAVPVLMPAERAVIEVLETVTVDDEVMAGCRRLVDQGYRLALDDFVWFDGAEALLDLASVVKIDVRATPAADLPALADRCRPFDVTLLAEKVETAEELQLCEALGFELYQGYLLSRPQTVPGRTLDSATLSQVRLAAALVQDEFEVGELEEIVRADPPMGVQLLQLAGVGADHGMRGRIRTLREALVLLGARRLQNWIAFLVLTQRGTSSREQIALALARARMCELLAGRLDPAAAPMAFTAGMLSTLDILFESPLEQIIDALPLSDELHEATLGRGEGVGRVVRAVIEYQAGAQEAMPVPDLGPADLHRAGGEALAWAVHATRAQPS
jgi:EAL and modified HD-GYP domain-containing signal transduction protein